MTEEEKLAIDKMTYEEMLEIWRFSPVGDKRLVGDKGDYFQEQMLLKKQDVDASVISKRVGWNK